MTYSIIAEGLVKRYGETVALDGIDLAVRTGTVFGLLGPNGAGKTTAVRILATLIRPDGGHATVCGQDVTSPRVLYLDEPTTGLDPLSRNEMWDVVRGLTATGVTVLLTTQYLEEADQLAEDIAVVDHGTVIATGTPDELKARTGAQTLSVRPANPADVPAVMAIVTGFSPSEPEVRNTTVTVPVAQEDVLPSVMRRFEDAGIRVAELNLRGSSLDEVFLSLTGRRTETEAEVLEGSAA